MIQTTKLGERIALAVERAGGKAAAVLKMGIPASTLDRYIRDETEPSASKLAKIAEASGIPVEWLIYGVGDPSKPGETTEVAVENDDSDTVFIPLMSVVGAAGDGIENHQVEEIDRLPFSRKLLRRLGVILGYAQFIQAAGDSMLPTIGDGGICLIDTSKTRPRGGGVYALAVGDELLIKRLQVGAKGLTLISDNSDKYPSETIAGDELGRVRIFGRVFWTGSGI